jgi:hypothetical protein
VTYLLDSNVFISAKNLYYGFDFCSAFWSWLDEGHRAARVFSIEKVRDELRGGADELTVWANDRPAMFLKPDATIVPSMQKLSEWAEGASYEPAAVNTFLQLADYYLVAHAHAHGYTVVTHELADGSRKRIKIPEACIAVGVKFMNTFEMLRAERARFVLGKTPDEDQLFT